MFPVLSSGSPPFTNGKRKATTCYLAALSLLQGKEYVLTTSVCRCKIGSAVRADFRRLYPANRQDVNVLPKRRQSHQGDKLCDVSTVPLVARGPVFLARGSDADGEPISGIDVRLHCTAALYYSSLQTKEAFRRRHQTLPVEEPPITRSASIR